MLIRCPTCASGYELASDLLSHGRILRCAHCRDAWAYSPGAPEIRSVRPMASSGGLEIVSEARSTHVGGSRRLGRGAIRSSRPRRRGIRLDARRLGSLAAAALVLAVSSGGMAAVAARERMVAAFPPSAAVFAALGLPVNLRGLAFSEIRSTIVSGDGAPVLTLDGHITNLRREAMPLPPLRIAVRDKSRRELYYWTAPAPKSQIGVGETVLFHSRLSAPPRDGQDLAVSFVEASTAPRRVAEADVGGR